MELEEMKLLWSDLNVKVEKQSRIQQEMIMKITRQKYRSKLEVIRLSEMVGSVVCFIYVAYLMSHFGELVLWYNRVLAIVSMLILIIPPILSLRVLRGMKNLQVGIESPAVLLQKFARRKLEFWKIQRMSMLLSGVLLLTVLLPFTEIEGTGNRLTTYSFWMIYIPLALLFMLLFSRWVWSKYKGAIEASEQLLSELNESRVGDYPG